MVLDLRSLTPTQLIRLLNSTPLGEVVNAPKLSRQMNRAGLCIAAAADGRPRRPRCKDRELYNLHED